MIFEVTRDHAAVTAILTAPKQFPEFAGKLAGLLAQSQCVLAHDELGTVGVFLLVERNPVLAEVHIGMLPAAFGRRTVTAGNAFREWCWTHTPFERIVAHIAAGNALARRYSEAVGMRLMGINPRAMLRRGQLSDVAMYGVSRSEA